MLEDAVEEMSTTFIGLSDTVLQSKRINAEPELMLAIGDYVRHFLTVAKSADQGADENPEVHLDDHIGTVDSSSSVGLSEQVISHDEMSIEVMRPTPDVSQFGAGTTGSLDFPMSGMHYNPDPRAFSNTPTPSSVQRMLTQNFFFSKEFWSGDYINHHGLLPTEQTRPRPIFWQRLLRTSLITGCRALCTDSLSADGAFVQRWAERQYRYSLSHRSKAFILAMSRNALAAMAKSDELENQGQPYTIGQTLYQQKIDTCVKAIFDNDDFRAFGATTVQAMLTDGYPVDDLLDAEEVEGYLKEKGLVSSGESEMQMELAMPRSSHEEIRTATRDAADDTYGRDEHFSSTLAQAKGRSHRGSSPPRRQSRWGTRLVTINIQSLADSVTQLAVCMGGGIGYPRQLLNSAIVASVVRIGD